MTTLAIVLGLLCLCAIAGPCMGDNGAESTQPGLAFVLFDDTALQRPANHGVDAQVNMALEGYNDCSKLWMGALRLPADGEVRFEAECAQGLRLFIDGKRIIDGWSPDGERSGIATGTAGDVVPIRLEYYHLGGESYLRLYWSYAGQARELVPPSAFSSSSEDQQHVKAIREGKEWVGLGNQGPAPRLDVAVLSAPAGDEAFASSTYEPGNPGPVPADTPIALGEGPHLFIDDLLIETSEGITRRVNRPVRDPAIPNPIVTGPGDRNFQPFMTVVRDPETARFRIWYGAWKESRDAVSSHIGYMESEDGIHWLRPHKTLEDAAPIQFGDSVIDEGPDSADPATRFKLGWWADGGLKIATSPDGIQWAPLSPQPVLRHNHDITNIWRDPIRDRYVATVSVYTTGPRWSGTRRVTMQSVSDDLLHWEVPWYIITPAEGVDEGEIQFYAMNGHIARGGLWIGLVKVLRDDLRAENTPEGAYGVGYTSLAWSRDGRHWVRDPEPFFEPDPSADAWDHAHAWLDYQVPVDDEVYIYYGGYKSGHKMNRFEERQIGLVRMRRDRYVARAAGDSEGTMRTPPVELEPGRVTVNAAVRGNLQVAILGADGDPLPGFSARDCDPISGDAVAHPVSWNGVSDIPGEGPMRLEFRLRDAELYSFDLVAR